MATTIRLTRMGKKKRPFYRLVAMDSRKRRDGAYLANLGYYNPFVEPFQLELHEDEIIAWLQKGATLSGTARALLRTQGVLYKYSLLRQGLSEDDIAGKMAAWRDGADARRSRAAQALAEKRQQAAAAKAEAEAAAAAAKVAEAEPAEAEEQEPAAETAAEEPAAETETAAEPAEEPAVSEPEADAADADES